MSKGIRLEWLDANSIASKLSIGFAKVDPTCSGQTKFCGSLRRKCATVGDIDVVTMLSKEQVDEAIRAAGGEVVRKGHVIGTLDGMQINVMHAKDWNYGAAVLHYTGSQVFNVWCRMRAKKFGLKLSQYGLKNGAGQLVGSASTEAAMFETLQMRVVPPTMRDSVRDTFDHWEEFCFENVNKGQE